MGKALRDHYLRIDARSLGFFRLAFAVVLLTDLFRRWRYLKDFYSNEGVLPNHNHLFNLRETGQVWSFLHAFSTPGENLFAFILILCFYVFFLIGYKTRAFHALSLVCLVSLTGRNILLENAGNYAAIALLAFTLFLPLGSRFSLDSLLASLAQKDEKTAAEINDRPAKSAEQIDRERTFGWTPTSFAAFAVLAQIAVIYLATALQQRGAWLSGTALYYGLNSERFVSSIGASVRSLSPGLLSAWTRVLYAVGWAIPVLIFLPVARSRARWAAIALMIFHGLTLGLLFSFGLYAWSLLAAATLLVPTETWERLERTPVPSRLRTVIYDADCGICLWLARFIQRLDLRGNLTFQGNDDIAEILIKKPGKKKLQRIAPPKELTAEVVNATVVVIDANGHVFTRSRAVAEVIQALPLGWLKAWAFRIPGISHVLDAIYDFVANRRQQISVAFGKEACGIPAPPEEAEATSGEAEAGEVAPSVVLGRRISGALRDIAVFVIFAAMLAQTTHANALPFKLPQGKVLAAVSAWPRMIARWNVLTPEPPADDEVLITDAQTKGAVDVDVLTGKKPEFNPGAMRGTGLGQLWGDYLARMHEKEWFDFQRAFKDYLVKGGPGWDGQAGDNQIMGLDAYWLKQPIPAPGEARSAEATREKMFTHSRGGRLGVDKTFPIFRPDIKQR